MCGDQMVASAGAGAAGRVTGAVLRVAETTVWVRDEAVGWATGAVLRVVKAHQMARVRVEMPHTPTTVPSRGCSRRRPKHSTHTGTSCA